MKIQNKFWKDFIFNMIHKEVVKEQSGKQKFYQAWLCHIYIVYWHYYHGFTLKLKGLDFVRHTTTN